MLVVALELEWVPVLELMSVQMSGLTLELGSVTEWEMETEQVWEKMSEPPSAQSRVQAMATQ
jgi:hypothetical protein